MLDSKLLVNIVCDYLQPLLKCAQFVASPAADRQIRLYMTPEDAFRRPLTSTSTQTANVLMKVTLPKLTGRKRKRGSLEPFLFHDGGRADPGLSLIHI